MGEVKSPLRWTGGKFCIADWIISLMPKHETYVEPFFGAGWVLFYEGVKDRLLVIHKRLRGVTVLNRNWKDMVLKYDGEEWWYERK